MNKAQEFRRLKKRKKIIKRLVISSIIIVTASIVFIYKAPIFNVKQINFTGITTVNEKELQDGLKDYLGKNIFTVDYKEIQEKILANPYIKEVKINKKSNAILNISIKEGKVAYYIQEGEIYKAITNDGFYVEQLKTLEGRNLVSIIGAKDNGKEVGQKIIDDENTSKILNAFHPIIKSNISELRIERLDISDILNIKGYIKGVEILFGDDEDLVRKNDKAGKIDKVLSILEQKNIQKGYIDVSFDGPPVVKIES
ncbi:FtsQ-type POTRA domain-containing protein [Clostridium gasigenes]|uniref:cell division protein FtsQ/DivIB n=1 Tax=Clostridium gasigenes TaxID=94869 RepID=UPI0014382C59|nr:FtsQ-type POTRA domain-containing protein [Clostridium gasigenes]MBU3131481.1 FtsQ-type POTRA domain-containing protein [Clostridium gasigenes]MBU3134982.1 FtsQ-type POTRA domain-containing protein [Clostridium gasigenes]NKF05268.1 FtsQ-type POTRA domain-containing protein [Clostridium gasigenes]QSW18723.1 FtsQ-type POTRA domain-containing protein [Clostridium gasigenes]